MKVFKKFLKCLFTVDIALGCLSLAALIILTIAGVFWRRVFNHPFTWLEEIQLACMFMNYLYTDEGALLLNYGTEGVSFEYQEDGTPWYTDLILNNPDGLTQMQAMISYACYYSPGKADATKYNISAVTLYSDYTDVWIETDNDYAMPPVILTVDEQDAVNEVNGDIRTYLDEVIIKFYINDLDPNDDAVWQEYLDTMDQLGVQQMIEAYEAAYERFINA